jgi:hypothetical protein
LFVLGVCFFSGKFTLMIQDGAPQLYDVIRWVINLLNYSYT